MPTGDWTHAICYPCYIRIYPERPSPHRVIHARETRCCFCVHLTKDGSFVRADPALPELQCQKNVPFHQLTVDFHEQ